MTLNNVVLLGLLGSFLMFLGDMFLYYDHEDYDGKDTINSIVDIMKNVSIKRLYIGGILGPICAFIYILGFLHIVLISNPSYLTMGWIVFSINTLGIIFGSAYHIQCAYLGLLSRYENKGAFDEFLKFLKFQSKIVFSLMALGNIGLIFMIFSGFTVLSRWQAFFTPIFLMMLTPMINRLPKGVHIIIRGGWLNIIYIIYYLSLFICI